VGAQGGTYPAVFNAANEQAVHAFHQKGLAFLAITEVIDRVVLKHPGGELTLESVLEAEAWARRTADEVIASL
jgi:1-deoxy-D-xylulose-5-phosphate reductoisomerase